jgi:hypothetical protein
MPEAGCWAGNGVEAASLGVLTLGNSQSRMLSKELDREADQHTGHGEQDQRLDVDVEYEEARLLEELDALVVERDVCRCEQRGQSTEHCRVDHQQGRTGLQRRLRFAGRRDLHVRLLARLILDWRVGIRDRGIRGPV